MFWLVCTKGNAILSQCFSLPALCLAAPHWLCLLRGHGTYAVDGKLYASLAGVVERVNKLIYVKPLKSR